MTWLNVRHGRATSLGKGDGGSGNEGAQEQIGKWKNDVQIFTHVAVMKEVVTVQTEKDS